jgi:hypothetical protein
VPLLLGAMNMNLADRKPCYTAPGKAYYEAVAWMLLFSCRRAPNLISGLFKVLL